MYTGKSWMVSMKGELDIPFSICHICLMEGTLGNEPSWPCDESAQDLGEGASAPVLHWSWTAYAQAFM